MKSIIISSLILMASHTLNGRKAAIHPPADGKEYRAPGSVNQFGNQIGNAYALQPLKKKIRRTDSSLVLIKVLHIGDSHVKSGFFSQHFMERLNAFYGKKYRGNLFFNFQVFCKIGTKYADYDELAELDNQLVREKPDLVIVSLGTNDAFSGSCRQRFYEKIDHLVVKIKSRSPQSVILLTTPSDALKRNPLTGVYTALPELKFVVDVIIRYANDHQLAYWDLYRIMGGDYSVNNWLQKKMAAPDRVHFSAKGYLMFADWLFEAFTASLESNSGTLPFNLHY